MIRRLAKGLVGTVVLGAAAWVAHAQGPVLHEFVPDVREDEALVFGGEDGAEPAAIVYDGEILDAPEGGALREDERAMSAIPGDGLSQEEVGRRSPTFRPDRVTELESTLGYYSVFTPSIAPFKRVTALDGVRLAHDGETPELYVAEPRVLPVPVVGAGSAAIDSRDRDTFWGSVVLDFTSGSTVPLPSVSPESRILTWRTEPDVQLTIQQDYADNFFVVASGVLPVAKQVRVTFLTDAPRVYFNGPIPEVAVDSLASEARPLPPSVRRSAGEFARELGLSSRSTLAEALSTLTEHFRSFEESREPPDDSGDIYLDLARSMKGVCRHRAYAFVITALGLGIPARFVMNEAHAWVEVRIPETGWMRIDLGGAAAGLEAHNSDDRPVYRAVHPDPLPRPEPYERSYSRLRDVQGLRPDQLESAGDQGSNGADGRAPGGDDEGSGSSPSAPGSGSSSGTSSSAAVESGSRGVLTLSVSPSRFEVLRGRSLEVSGFARSDTGPGVGGLRVEVLLRDRRERLLGVTVTHDNGRFTGTFGVPPDLDVGEYDLIVRTPGDSNWYPAQAD